MTEENHDFIFLERQVIGSVLVGVIGYQSARKLIASRKIQHAHFNDPWNKLSWTAISRIVMEGGVTNPITVNQWFGRNCDSTSEKERSILRSYLVSLVGNAVEFCELASLLQTWQDAHPQIKTDDWSTWYNGYLKSPDWRSRRSRVMERCGDVCEGCADSPATQVHHLTYGHVGEEFLFELVGLCGGCHDRIHNRAD